MASQYSRVPGGGTFYGTQDGVLAASLNKALLMSQGLSPSDIACFSIDPATAGVTASGDSPCHGTYPMQTPFHLSGDEALLFTSAGTISIPTTCAMPGSSPTWGRWPA